MKHLRARWDETISCSGRISSSLVVGLNTTTGRVRSAASQGAFSLWIHCVSVGRLMESLLFPVTGSSGRMQEVGKSSLPHLHCHNVVGHVEAVANVEVAPGSFVHTHMFVELPGADIVPVHIQFHNGRQRGVPADVVHSKLEHPLPDRFSLESGPQIDFLQVPQPFPLLLQGNIPNRYPVIVDNVVNVPLLGDLLVQVFL